MHLQGGHVPACRLRTVSTPVALALLPAIAVGCGGPSAPDGSEARTVIEQFLEQIRNGDVDSAWESTTADFKSDEGRDAFRRFVMARPVLVEPLEFKTLEQVEVHGLVRWEATLHPIAGTAGDQHSVKVMIAQEDGAWKVERLTTE